MSAPGGSGPTRVAAVVCCALVAALLVVWSPAGEAAPVGPSACRSTITTPLRPVSARFGAVRSGASFRVVPVGRTRDGAVGTPPVTRAGKQLVGWDRQTRPGARVGTVILDAHTWPDGSALGNALLRSLRSGALIAVRLADGRTACYQVRARRSYPASRVPRTRAFRSWGPEQLVMVVCSGKRLGPGRWTRRTVWYAVPVVAR